MISGLRIWVAGVALATILVLAGSFVVGVQPQLAAADASDQTAMTVEATNQAARIKIVALTKQAAKLDAMQAEDASLRKAVPTVLKPNRFIRRVNQIAALDGVTVTSVAPGAATAYAPAPSLTSGGATAGAIAIGRTDPVVSATNLAYVPVSVSVTGTYAATIAFTHDIQNGERLFAVSSLQTAADDKGLTTATIAGGIYTLKR